MGKGDKKSRRGKIILGSSGVRRPKPRNKAFGKVEAIPASVTFKSKKGVAASKPEPKPKVKALETAAVAETEVAVAPQKTNKKAVAKPKVEASSEKE